MHSDVLNSDLYAVLGVADDASAEEIAKAYRKLAREHHPDISEAPDAEERFKEISTAYDVLGDADKRAEYDEFRSMVGSGFAGDAFYGAGGPGPRGRAGPGGMPFDLSDLFGGGATFRMPTVAHVRLSFDDAMRGAVLDLDGEPVRLPAGIADGETVQVGPDLLVTVSVAPHPVFGRDGDDLTVDVPVDFPTAALGGKVSVPTYDGKPVTIKVPAGTRPGRTFRVRGRGARGGDLLATVTVSVPTELTDDQREALERLREVL